MSEKTSTSIRRPEGLTDEEFARFRELAYNYNAAKVEADMLELLTHPETWVSTEQVKERLTLLEKQLR